MILKILMIKYVLTEMLLIFLFVKNRAQSWDFLEKIIKEEWNYEIVNKFKIT